MKEEKREKTKKPATLGWLMLIVIVATAGITASAISATGLGGPDVAWGGGSKPAARSGAPVIVWGTPIGHGDRGECTNCHNVVFPEGAPLPTITALSAMPHEFRGVCNNCHRLEVSKVSWLVGLLDRLFE